MDEIKENKKLVPPYIFYKTFLNFLERLEVGIPTRIDRSVVSSYSGAVQAQLFTALKFLSLMSESGIPTEKLKKLIELKGTERQKSLKEIITESYPFLFKEGFDLKRATLNHFQELFEKEGASGGTTRKCMMFFMAAAKNSGIELSPHLKKSKVSSSQHITPKKRKTREEKHSDFFPPEDETNSTQPTWQQIVLSKFPPFDPAWSPEVQAKWFEGFNKLMDRFDNKKGEI